MTKNNSDYIETNFEFNGERIHAVHVTDQVWNESIFSKEALSYSLSNTLDGKKIKPAEIFQNKIEIFGAITDVNGLWKVAVKFIIIYESDAHVCKLIKVTPQC